jgi:hypothetical protein
MKTLKKILLRGAAALMLSAPMARVHAGAGMTCADYDKPDVYSSCEMDSSTGNANCCAGLVAFKAVCDLFHGHVESHKAASDMLESSRGRHEWAKDYKACTADRGPYRAQLLSYHANARAADFPKAMAPRNFRAADFPFVGTWDCGISDFAFTNRTYNNGSETFPILKAEKITQRMFRSEKGATSYRLKFAKGYAISLMNVTSGAMIWHSLATADTFNCKRH